MTYAYRDLEKQPLTGSEIASLAVRAGLSTREILNARRPAFRSLKVPAASVDDRTALDLILSNPRLMIRPVLSRGQQVVFGYGTGFQQLAGRGR